MTSGSGKGGGGGGGGNCALMKEKKTKVNASKATAEKRRENPFFPIVIPPISYCQVTSPQL
jgi:hypothetical protein